MSKVTVKVKVTWDKKKLKKCGILFGSGPRGAVLYAGGKISACCLVFLLYFAKCCNEYVCLCVCLSVREDISGTARAIFTKFLCMLPMSMARSSSGTLTIGRIARRREGGDGSGQRGQSVIYDCLVVLEVTTTLWRPLNCVYYIIFIKPRRGTTYVDATYCYRLSRVVCRSVCLSRW